MRAIALAAVLAAASALAQSPLTTSFQGGNQGNIGGGLYFNLVVNTTVTITQIDFNAGANAAVGTAGNLSVFLGPSTWVGNVQNPALWTMIASGPVATNATGTPTACVLNGGGFALGPGTYGVALGSQGFNWAYTNGGVIPTSFATAEIAFQGGGAQNVFLDPVAPVFSPRVFNGSFHFTPGGVPITVAAQEKYGAGCYGQWTSFYELWGNPASNDLSNTTVTLAFRGDHYDVALGGTPYTQPSAAAAIVPLASGSSSFLASSVLPPSVILYPAPGGVGIALDLEICTDGYITPDPLTNVVDSSPTVAEFLGGALRWAPHWKNQDAVALGNMTLEVEVATGAYVVSWNGVQDNEGVGVATTSTYQVAFLPGGDVEFRYGAMSGNGGGSFPELVGFTFGGGALDRGVVDVTAGPFSTDGVDNVALDVSLDARPVLGTHPNIVVRGYGNALLGALVLSFTAVNPGIDLLALGMPGCAQHVVPDFMSSFFTTPAPGPTTFAFLGAGGIPNLPAFNGATVFAQAISVTPGFNGAGLLSSNGLRLLLGSL